MKSQQNKTELGTRLGSHQWAREEVQAVLVGLVVNVGNVLLQLVPMGEHLSTDMAHHLLWLRRSGLVTNSILF